MGIESRKPYKNGPNLPGGIGATRATHRNRTDNLALTKRLLCRLS